jgi:hypothetical protein
MLKQLQKWGARSFIASLLLSQSLISSAQNTLKEAARAAKVSPDLLTIQTSNGAPVPQTVRGFVVKNPVVQFCYNVAKESVAIDQSGEELLLKLRELGLQNGVYYKRVVSGYLPIDKIGALKSISGLKFARPAYQPQHNSGSVTSQGDKAMRADVARQTHGLSGAGSKIGIISDSYNKLGGATAGVASGDLPAHVQVLADYFQASVMDEGRAMAELVHDVAPGASIAFHTAEGGQPVFAKGIKDLALAGCNIIVDDIIYYAEPFFQDGIIAQAVEEVVTSHNVSYFASAGNQARSSYQAGFKNSGVNIPNYGQAHDFGNGDIRQRITIPAGGSFQMALQWDDPFYSVSGAPGAQSDLDILAYSTEGNLISGSFSVNIDGDPFEFMWISNDGSAPLSFDLVIVKFEGPDPGLIKWVNFGSRNIAIEYDTKSSALYGHTNAAHAVSVAAAPYFNTPAFKPNLSTALVEDFSSAGGTPILFTGTGKRRNETMGTTRQKPDITAVDGTNTTFFYPGDDAEGDGFPNFYGTSAAAPHAAAVAALMQQRAGNSLSANRIRSIMQTTALDMDDPFTPEFDTGFDVKTGYGLLQADRAIQALNQPLVMVEPDYNCATGQITFKTTGGNGSAIEYRGNGITDWNLNPLQFIDAPVRADQNSTTVFLQARQNGVEVTYTFNFRAYCKKISGSQLPVLANAIGNQPARQGSYFSYQFPVNTFSDPNNAPLTYSVMGLPAGLAFDAANRRIAGTPTQAGTFPIVITATNPGHLSAQATFSIIVAPAASNQPLALIAPLYDCKTGHITFRTVGGDGTTITYTAIGIKRNAQTDATGVVEAELRGDPKPIVITATQRGRSVSYTFDFAAYCTSGSAPVQPTSETFALIAPAYSCATGVFTFQATGIKTGKIVEYYSVPGITDWSTNPTHQFNYDLRTAGDVKPFTLRARYVGEPGSEVTLVWVRPAPCSVGARIAADEPGKGLQITVLGNPIREEYVEIDILGTQGHSLRLRVSNGRGEWVSEQTVELTGMRQRQRVDVGRVPGTYLLQVGTDTERRTIKLVRQ